jgi:hypothetical protein
MPDQRRGGAARRIAATSKSDRDNPIARRSPLRRCGRRPADRAPIVPS